MSTVPAFNPRAALLNPATPEGTRALVWAVVVSIVIHAALLFLFPGLRQGSPPPTVVMKARIVDRAAPSPVVDIPPPPAPVPEVKRPEPAPPPPPPKPQAVPLKPAAPIITAPTPAPSAPVVAAPPPVPTPPVVAPAPPPPSPPVQAAPPAPAQTAPTPAPAQGAPTRGAPPARAESTVPPAPPVAAFSAAELKTIDQLRFDLGNLIKKRFGNSYPKIATEQRWEGRSVVLLTVEGGKFKDAKILESSGHSVLDEDASRKIRAVVPELMLTVPASLRAKEFSLRLPIDHCLVDSSRDTCRK